MDEAPSPLHSCILSTRQRRTSVCRAGQGVGLGLGRPSRKLSCNTCPQLGGCDVWWVVYSLSAHPAPPAVNCCFSKPLL